MDTVTDTGEMPHEQAAELAALMQAAQGGTPVPGAAPEAEKEDAPDLAGEIAGAILMVVGILRPALPSVAALYPPEVAGGVGAAVAEVCKKHGWLEGGFMGEWKEEIACVLMVGPLAYATYDAAKGDIAVLKAAKIGTDQKQQPAQIQAPEAPAVAAVTFGEVKAA